MGQVLTSKVQYQNSARVGMSAQRRQKSSGLGVVMTGLGASEGMGKCVQSVDASLDQVLIVADQSLGNIVDTADGRDDPDLIADRRSSVFSPVTHEGLGLKRYDAGNSGVIGVLHLALEVGHHVVGVNPLAGFDILGGVPDGQAVFHDHVAFCDVLKSHLVALRDLLHRCGTAESGACGRGMEGNCYIINVVDLNKYRHGYLSFPGAIFCTALQINN